MRAHMIKHLFFQLELNILQTELTKVKIVRIAEALVSALTERKKKYSIIKFKCFFFIEKIIKSC